MCWQGMVQTSTLCRVMVNFKVKFKKKQGSVSAEGRSQEEEKEGWWRCPRKKTRGSRCCYLLVPSRTTRPPATPPSWGIQLEPSPDTQEGGGPGRGTRGQSERKRREGKQKKNRRGWGTQTAWVLAVCSRTPPPTQKEPPANRRFLPRTLDACALCFAFAQGSSLKWE